MSGQPSPPSRAVLIIGSSGTIGTHITKAFAEAAGWGLRVGIFTSENTYKDPKKQQWLDSLRFKGVEILVGDLNNDEEVKKAFNGWSVIISALGRNVLHLQPHLADLIAELPRLPNGAPRRFFPSEYGTDIRYDEKTSPHEKPHQNKLKTRAHVEALAAKGLIEFTYIVTGPFLDTFIYARAGDLACYSAKAGTFGIVGSADGADQHRISGTTYADTGRYVLSAVRTLPESKNATLRVSSVDAKPEELLAAVRKATNNNDIKPIYTDLDKFRQMEKEQWEKNPQAATVWTLTRIWFEGGSDFTKKPRALYLVDGKEREDKQNEHKLFKDVERRDADTVVRDLLK